MFLGFPGRLTEILSDCLHPMTVLYSRLVNFAKSLTECKKSAVGFLGSLCLKDLRTVMGKNLSDIAFEISSNVASMTPITSLHQTSLVSFYVLLLINLSCTCLKYKDPLNEPCIGFSST